MIKLSGKRHALVTGATGFVGLNLVRELLAQGWRVTALHRRDSKLAYLKGLEVELAVADVLDLPALDAALPQAVDALFHVAADTSTWSRHNARQTRTNVEGTRNLVELALTRRVGRFILTSTVSAYGRHKTRLTETTPSVAGRSWVNYERSKWLAEEEVRAGVRRGLDAVILNPSAVLGPFDEQTWASTFLLIRDGALGALPPGRTEFNHVADVVKAHVAAVDHGRRGENYILTGAEASFADLFRMMADLMSVELKAKVLPAPVLMAATQLMALGARFSRAAPALTPELAALMSADMLYDTHRARHELGYQHSSLTRCVGDSYAWLRAEGRL